MTVDATYSAFAAARGLEPVPALGLGAADAAAGRVQALPARAGRPRAPRRRGRRRRRPARLQPQQDLPLQRRPGRGPRRDRLRAAPLLHPQRAQHPRRRVLRLRGPPLEALDREHGAERALHDQHQPLPGPELDAAAVLAGPGRLPGDASPRPTSPSSSPTAPCSAASRTTTPAPTAWRRSARRPPTSPNGSPGSAGSSDADQPHRHLPDRLLRAASAWRCASARRCSAPTSKPR